jgi:Skp family chaperone for outer membrane proteins
MNNKIMLLAGLCISVSGASIATDKNVSTANRAVKRESSKELSVADLLEDGRALDAKIRFVQTFTVMGEGEPGKLERKEIESKRDLATQEIQQESQKLEKTKTEYVAKASTMTDKAREAEEKKMMKMERDLKNLVAEKEEELKVEMQIATEKLAIDMESAVIELAKEDSIDIVFDTMTGRAIYVAKDFDLTNKVIQRVNERHTIKLAQQENVEGVMKVAAGNQIVTPAKKVS